MRRSRKYSGEPSGRTSILRAGFLRGTRKIVTLMTSSTSFFRSHIRKGTSIYEGRPATFQRTTRTFRAYRSCSALFPDAQVLVPFRRPVDHAVSMWRQHQNFTQIHAEEPFARRYMADIGHYDFGANLRPVAFRELSDSDIPDSPDDTQFWLRYWCTAFEHILKLADLVPVALVNYDRLCDDPTPGLRSIYDLLDIADTSISQQASRFRPSNSYDGIAHGLSEEVTERAAAVHLKLEGIAINQGLFTLRSASKIAPKRMNPM